MEDDKTRPLASQDARAGRDSAAAAALHVGASSDEPAAMPAAGAERAPRSMRVQRIGVGVVAVLSALLIGVSAFSLAGGGPAHERDGAGDAPAAVGPSVDDGAEDQASDEDASDGSQDAADEADASASEGASAATEVTEQSAVATSVEQAPAPQASAPQAQPSANDQSAARMVNVTVTVDSSIVGNPVSGSGTFSLPRGSTVYDALCQLATPNGGPDYVRAIGGLAEFDHGAQSGWKYSVNGVDGTGSCGAYVLSDGDVVVWRYVTSLNG